MQATEKQVKYLMTLVGLLERSLKREYSYFDSDNSTIVALMKSVESAVLYGKDITKSQASIIIKILEEKLDE